jgi:ankyrin repeat protein
MTAPPPLDPYFHRLLDGEIDWQAIEGARGEVRKTDLASLVACYEATAPGDLARRMAVFQLLQDHLEDVPDRVMLDVLCSPPTRTWLDDTVEISKAIALGALSEEHDRFNHHYNDRAALRSDVAAFLTARGMSVRPAAPPSGSLPDAANAARAASSEERMLRACIGGDVDAARALLDEGVPVDLTLAVPDVPNDRSTPLLVALIKGRDEVAELLLERGASVSAQRAGGQTPLWWAAVNGSTALVRLLLEAGADPAAADQWRGTPMHQAVKGGAPEVAALLLDAGAPMCPEYHDGRTPMWFAAHGGLTPLVELFLDRGHPIDAPSHGSTPLMLAAKENHLALLERLLRRGADPNAYGAAGMTPLMHAAQRGYPRIVKALRAAGADPSLRAGAGRYEGKTAAELATGRRADAVRSVLEP